jgi:hypothetical protein
MSAHIISKLSSLQHGKTPLQINTFIAPAKAFNCHLPYSRNQYKPGLSLLFQTVIGLAQ